MKRFLVLILIGLMVTQAFSKWVMLFDYQWNKEYIAANLCENKTKPALKCEGKCQLTKKMVEEETESSPQPQKGKPVFQEVVYTNDIVTDTWPTIATISALPSTFYQFRQNSAPVASIFHPPA